MFKFILFLTVFGYYLGQFTNTPIRIIIHSSIILISIFFNLYYIFKIKKGKIRTNNKINYFLVYILLCFTSSLWSENYLETIYQSIYICTLYYNIKFFHENNDIKTVTYILSFSIILELLMVLSRKSGLNLNIIQTIHGVGSLQAMISVFILYSLPSKKSLFDKFLYLFNFIILILSSSGKVYLALLIITLYHLYIQKNYIINFFILTTITSLSLYVIKFLSSFDFGKLEHLGGRLLPWKMMIEKIKTSPFLGYGFPFGDEIYIDSNFTIQNAHNFIIGSTLYIGFLGPILLILYFKEAYNKSKNILYVRYLIIGIIITANFNISISGKLNIPLISALLVLTYSQNLYSKNHA